MKTSCLKLKSWLLISAMSLLGLSACKKEPQIRPMYGVIPDEYRSVPMADGALSQDNAIIQDVVKAVKDED